MDDVLRWSNSSRLDASQRRTDEDERTRWTVSIDRYKAMSLSLGRITETKCLFPDPQGLVQEVRNKDTRFKIPILKDMVFLHLMKVALVTEPTRTGKLRRQVKKIGIDPHAAFANMLCDVAWARAHGTATFLIDDGAPLHPTAPDQHPVAHLIRHRQSEGTCGGCANFKIKDGSPGEHGAGVCAFHSTGANECTVQDIDPENGCYGYNPQG